MLATSECNMKIENETETVKEIQVESVLDKFNLSNNLRAFALLALGAGGLVGCSNVETPGGYVGYITQGAIVGKTEFVGLQTGPTSSGLSWQYHGVNVSVTPFTFQETFDLDKNPVITKNKLKVGFELASTWRVRPGRVKEFVEQYSTMAGDESIGEMEKVAYDNYVQKPFVQRALNAVQSEDAFDLNTHVMAISARVLAEIQEYTKDTPFEILSVSVSNIQFPKEVADEIALKVAATQREERMETEKKITIQQADIRLEEAKGIAKSMSEIKASLTPEYLQYESIKAMQASVGSPNHTVVYIPVGNMGIPLVGTLSAAEPSPK